MAVALAAVELPSRDGDLLLGATTELRRRENLRWRAPARPVPEEAVPRPKLSLKTSLADVILLSSSSL